MRMLSPRAARALDAAAEHLAGAVRRLEPAAAFAPTSLVVLGRIEHYLPLSAELAHWYHTLAPARELALPDRDGQLRIYAASDLLARQAGRRWRALPGGEPGRRIEEWPTSWVAVGDGGGAPIIAVASALDTPIGLARMNSEGWTAALLAPTLALYLEALARWLEIMLSVRGAHGAADVARAGGVTWRARDGDTTELDDALARALMPLLPAEAVVTWLPPR